VRYSEKRLLQIQSLNHQLQVQGAIVEERSDLESSQLIILVTYDWLLPTRNELSMGGTDHRVMERAPFRVLVNMT
jgi:hypothetical protein